MVDQELGRLVHRLSDVERPHEAVVRASSRYVAAVQELEAVETEIRWASDSATNQLATVRQQEQRAVEHKAEQRQGMLERLIALMGTAFVIAALVPSLFGEGVKLPHPDNADDFLGMILITLGISGLVFWATLLLLSRSPAIDRPEPPIYTWLRRLAAKAVRALTPAVKHLAPATVLVALAMTVAGVVVLSAFG